MTNARPDAAAPWLVFEIRRYPDADPARGEVRGPTVTIGRDSRCTIAFPDIPTVSGRHAEIEVRGNECTIVDSRSQNHTFVNGVRVDGRRPLVVHDEIALGAEGPRLRLVSVGAVPAGRDGPGSASRAAPAGDAPRPAVRPARDLLVARRGVVERRPAAEVAVPAPPPAAPQPAAGGTNPGATTLVRQLGEEVTRLRSRAWTTAVALPLVLLAVGAATWYAGLLPSVTDWGRLLSKTERSVVLIRNRNHGEFFPELATIEATGSGFLVDNRGRVATNFHVIEGGDEVAVRFADDDTWHPASGYLLASREHDLAIIELASDAAKGRRPLRLQPRPPEQTDDVVAIGSPGGVEFISSRGNVEKITSLGRLADQLGNELAPDANEDAIAEGRKVLQSLRAAYDELDAAGRQRFLDEVIELANVKLTRRDAIKWLEGKMAQAQEKSGPDYMSRDVEIVVHSAQIAQGNSGGPLLDSDGAVIGVNSALLGRSGLARDFRFAVGAKHIVEGLPAADAVAKPFSELPR